MVVVATSGDPNTPPARTETAADDAAPVRYSERWWPSAGVWTSLAVVSLLAAATVVPIGMPWPLITSTGAAIGVTTAILRTCHTLRVTDDALTVGDRALPRHRIVTATPLDDAARRKAMGPLLDARSTLAIRGWIPTAVLLECAPEDAADAPVALRDANSLDASTRTHEGERPELAPPWIVSTRYPDALCDALAVPQGTLPTHPTVAPHGAAKTTTTHNHGTNNQSGPAADTD